MDIKKADKSPLKIEKKEHMKIPKTGADTVATNDGHFSFAKKVMKQEGISIVRDSTKAVSSSAAKKTTTELDGGEEINQATSIAATGVALAYKTASFAGKQLKKKTYAKSKIKKVQPGKKVAKSSVKKVGKSATKTVGKETTKTAVKAGVTATATIAGTLATGVGGPLIGATVGAGMEMADMKHMTKMRKLKFFLDKMNSKEKQKDNILKVARDLFLIRVVSGIKVVSSLFGSLFLVIGLILLAIIIPVIIVVVLLYNSPLAIYCPAPQENSIPTLIREYVNEFDQEVNQIATEHSGHETGNIVYVDYEGTDAVPSNYYDILAVYMARYGMGDTATVLNDATKEWAETVVDDMCNYSTSSGVLEVENEDGSVNTISALQVNVDLKTYQDMIAFYDFTDEQIKWVETLMSPQSLMLLDYTGIEGEVTSTSSLTMAEISEILSEVTDPVQQKVCAYALSKVGYPYSQAYRDTGNYYDCSSLAYYSWKAADVDISYGDSTTAAEEARGLEQSGKTVSYSELQPGDLIFFSYTNNGRYKNISHVAIYIGDGKVVEAKSTKYGVVYGDIPNANKIVLIGRPQ